MPDILNTKIGKALTYDFFEKYGDFESAYQPVSVDIIGNMHKGDVHFIGKIRTNKHGERFIIYDKDGVNITDDVVVLDVNIEFN